MKKKETTKRIVALLLAAVMLAMCCACSDDDDSQDYDTGDETENKQQVHRDNDENSYVANDNDTQSTDYAGDDETDEPSEPVVVEKTIRLEQCESTGEIEFEKISFDNTGFVYFTSDEAALFPFKYKSQYGYINDKGEIIISDQYDEAGVFSEEKAFVNKDGSWYVIDPDGKILFLLGNNFLHTINQFGKIIAYSTDVPTWRYSGNYYDYDYEHTIPHYKNGYAISSFIDYNGKSYKTYIRDSDNNIITFEGNDLFEDQLISNFLQASVNESPTFINNDCFIGIYSNLYYMKSAMEYGTISRIYDLAGNQIFSHDFDHSLSPISLIGDKYTKIAQDGKFAVIDFTTGENITDYVYDNIGNYSDGVLPVCNYDKWGLIDLDGNVLIKNKFEYLSAFSHGIGFALDTDGKGMLISKDGSVIAELPDEVLNGYSTNPFKAQEFTDNGFAYVTNSKTGKGYIITEKGEILFSGESDDFKYISSSYIIYEDDLYKVIVE